MYQLGTTLIDLIFAHTRLDQIAYTEPTVAPPRPPPTHTFSFALCRAAAGEEDADGGAARHVGAQRRPRGRQRDVARLSVTYVKSRQVTSSHVTLSTFN